MLKAGCLITLAGVVLTIASFLLFGGAIHRATDHREVANHPVETGERAIISGIRVDPEGLCRLEIAVRCVIPEEEREADRESSDIVSLDVPVNYRVQTPTEESVHQGAGELSGTVILQASGSSHEPDDPTLTHRSLTFAPPADGQLVVLVEMPKESSDGWQLSEGKLRVYDQVKEGAGGMAMGGFFALLTGPVIVGVGGLVFLIGILVAASRAKNPTGERSVG